jgi:hypothetical protein
MQRQHNWIETMPNFQVKDEFSFPLRLGFAIKHSFSVPAVPCLPNAKTIHSSAVITSFPS